MNTSELENYLCIEQGLKLGAVVSKKLVVGLGEMTIFKLTCVLQYIGQLQIKAVGSLQSMCTQFSLGEHAA